MTARDEWAHGPDESREGACAADIEGVRRARAYLLGVTEPPARALHVFVAEHGPLAAAELVRTGRVPHAVEQETSARRHIDGAGEERVAARRCGARLVTPEDDEWPEWPLLSLEVARGRGRTDMTPPLGLWVRGSARLDDVTSRAIAIVGARAATAYGEQVAADFAYELAAHETAVVSGAAYGIDGAAHRAALAAGGPTLAVLGCGLDAGYPAGHVGLLDRIAERGAVVSEYPFGTPPARHRFLVRNRLLAALSGGTVVVEAGLRSGARNTAGTAGAIGKAVMAVPGPVGSAMSAGCHRLIRECEATLVSSVAEVTEETGPLGVTTADEARPAARPTDGLGTEALRVHDALERRAPKSPECLAADSGVAIGRVRAVLAELEIEGLAQRCDSGWLQLG